MAHVDDSKEAAYAAGGRAARLAANGPLRQCRHWPMDGSRVCYVHGGNASQVRRAADTRVALAEQLENGERRPLWEVLLDAVHASDVLARREIADLRLAPDVTAAQVDRLVNAIDRAARLSRSGLDAGIAERRQRFSEAQASEMHRVFSAVLGRLGLTAEQRELVPAALTAEISPLLAIEGEVRP